MTDNLQSVVDKILLGESISDVEAYSLLDEPRTDLRDAAAKVNSRLMPRKFDTCSIINARSGKCPENCKWCAQSAHFSTGCEEYPLVDHDRCVDEARQNHEAGVGRFSLVASGRSVKGSQLQAMCGIIREINEEVGIKTCASMGLLGYEEMSRLKEAGVRRYHCNLETAPSHFATLCTTHTHADKLRTIAHAHALGMEVCSGGIIGMGETPRQRIEFALCLREARPVSIPVNVLCPIPGTPLGDAEQISEDEIIDTVAFFRLIHPRAVLRFAGGRKRLSHAAQLECIRVGITGAIVGDMLTTISNSVKEDKQLAAEAGYEF